MGAQAVLPLLPEVPECTLAVTAHEGLQSGLQQVFISVQTAWYGTVDDGLAAALSKTIFAQACCLAFAWATLPNFCLAHTDSPVPKLLSRVLQDRQAIVANMCRTGRQVALLR